MTALRDENTPPVTSNDRPRELVVDQDERVIVEHCIRNGRDMTRYRAVSRDEWIASLPEDTPDSVRRGLALAGVWSDLDWDETVEALDRIRHANPPTPPIEFDDEDFT